VVSKALLKCLGGCQDVLGGCYGHCWNVWVVARMFCVVAKALLECLGSCKDVLGGC